MVCNVDNRPTAPAPALGGSRGGDLRMIRVIAKLRQRQLQFARRGNVRDSARYARWVRRVSRAGEVCSR